MEEAINNDFLREEVVFTEQTHLKEKKDSILSKIKKKIHLSYKHNNYNEYEHYLFRICFSNNLHRGQRPYANYSLSCLQY